MQFWDLPSGCCFRRSVLSRRPRRRSTGQATSAWPPPSRLSAASGVLNCIHLPSRLDCFVCLGKASKLQAQAGQSSTNLLLQWILIYSNLMSQ